MVLLYLSIIVNLRLFIVLFFFSITFIFISLVYSASNQSTIRKAFQSIGIILTDNFNQNINTVKDIYRKQVYQVLNKNVFLKDSGLKFQVENSLKNAQFEKISRIFNDLNIESVNTHYIKFIVKELIQKSIKNKTSPHYNNYLKIINELK